MNQDRGNGNFVKNSRIRCDVKETFIPRKYKPRRLFLTNWVIKVSLRAHFLFALMAVPLLSLVSMIFISRWALNASEWQLWHCSLLPSRPIALWSIATEWKSLYTACFEYPSKWLKRCLAGYMAGATWNCCFLGACSVYTLLPCTSVQFLSIRSHMHFEQNDRDVLRATRGTDTEIRVSTESWQWKRKENLPPLLPGLEPETFRSRVCRSTTELSPLVMWYIHVSDGNLVCELQLTWSDPKKVQCRANLVSILDFRWSVSSVSKRDSEP